MAEHILHTLHVRPAGNGDRGRRVTEIMRTGVRPADAGGNGFEPLVKRVDRVSTAILATLPVHKTPRLVDWEQDYGLMIAPINRVIGREIRAVEYMHWWTFLAAYQEIGDCTFAQVVRIRDYLSRGKKLDKADQEWYRKNRHLVDFKRKYTSADDALMKEWGGT